jgi:hypothetical protein
LKLQTLTNEIKKIHYWEFPNRQRQEEERIPELQDRPFDSKSIKSAT